MAKYHSGQEKKKKKDRDYTEMDTAGVFQVFAHKHGSKKKHRKRNHAKSHFPKTAASEYLGHCFQRQKSSKIPQDTRYMDRWQLWSR